MVAKKYKTMLSQKNLNSTTGAYFAVGDLVGCLDTKEWAQVFQWHADNKGQNAQSHWMVTARQAGWTGTARVGKFWFVPSRPLRQKLTKALKDRHLVLKAPKRTRSSLVAKGFDWVAATIDNTAEAAAAAVQREEQSSEDNTAEAAAAAVQREEQVWVSSMCYLWQQNRFLDKW